MTNSLWSKGGHIVVNAAGRPILCEECPPCVPPACTPCGTTVENSTAKSVLFLEYEGITEGSCLLTNEYAQHDKKCADDSCNQMTREGRHSTPWPLQYTETNVGYAQPCTWGVTHDICPLDPYYYWLNSLLFFKYDSSEGFWFLHLQLSFQSSGASGDGGFFEWAINVSEGCDDFDDHDCHELEGCVTFDSSNLISDGAGIALGTLGVEVDTPRFVGFNCPCSTGWAGSYAQLYDWPYFKVTTTSWPGSAITATVTGW